MILTLTQLEFTDGNNTETLVNIARRLEVEIAAIYINMPFIKKQYANAVKSLVKEVFGRDLVLPPELFDKCMMVDGLIEYLTKNPTVVLHGIYPTTEAIDKIKSLVARIVISAIHSVFYSTNMIRLES